MDRLHATRVRPDEPSIVVKIGGEVDFNTAPQIRDILRQHASHRGLVVIDCVDVRSIDSSGVGTLIEFKRDLERAGGRLALCHVPGRVKNVLEVARLDHFFTIL